MRIHRQEENSIGVYLHIPFCISKCPYCDFRSIVASSVPEERYTRCLIREMSSLSKKEGLIRRPLGSIYIGGGTPSLFTPSAIEHLIRNVKGIFEPLDNIEVTLEANPDTLDPERLKGYRTAGVNRLSIGVQSLNDAELKALGRTHPAQKAKEALIDARAAGFENVGADLIFGAPAQSIRTWEESLSRVMELKPEHISLYGLTLEEGTPFSGIYKNKRALEHPSSPPPSLPPEEEEVGMYSLAIKLLSEGGYSHYEISNFALPGFYSIHNRRYWLGGDYLGLGVGAHSYLSHPVWGRRWWNEDTPEAYMRRVEGGKNAVSGFEALKKEEAMEESLILGLRMLESGVDGAAFERRFGMHPKEVFPGCRGLEREGLIKIKGEDLVLTPKGVLFSNEVFLRI